MSDLHRLNGMSTYLIGPIDNADDDGRGWREKITGPLEALGIIVFDPTQKPCDMGVEIGPEKDRVMRFKNAEDWDGLTEVMEDIVHVDLRCCQQADFIIAYVNPDILSCGTWHEIALASQLKIPTYIYCPQGKGSVPNWIFGIAKHENMYDSMDDILAFLTQVDTGEVDVDLAKWAFFDFSLIGK